MLMVPAATAGDVEIWPLIRDSGAMGRFVLLLLAVFSVISWGIIAERWRVFRKAERETESFLEQFKKGGGLAAIQDATTTLRESPLAHVFRAGFREISLNPPPGGAPQGDARNALHHRSRAREDARSFRMGLCSLRTHLEQIRRSRFIWLLRSQRQNQV